MIRLAAVLTLLASVQTGTAGRTPQRVTYKASDGVQIVADYYAPKAPVEYGAPAVIMLHQYPSTRSSWAPLAKLFQRAGYAVLAPDLRGHGESTEPAAMKLVQGKESRSTKHYRAANNDVLAAYAWLRGREEVDLSRLALVGASIGTSVAIRYASSDKSVDVVACLSPGPKYFGIDSTRDVARYGDRPILLLSPANERERSETLGKAARNATVRIIEDADLHGTFMFGKVPDIEKTVFEFVQAHIGRPTRARVLGSLKSDKYHRPTCSYVKADPDSRFAVRTENLRIFSSPSEAEARGYKPCKRCCGKKRD